MLRHHRQRRPHWMMGILSPPQLPLLLIFLFLACERYMSNLYKHLRLISKVHHAYYIFVMVLIFKDYCIKVSSVQARLSALLLDNRSFNGQHHQVYCSWNTLRLVDVDNWRFHFHVIFCHPYEHHDRQNDSLVYEKRWISARNVKAITSFH